MLLHTERAGLSLLEILTTVAIVILLSLLAIPYFNSSNQHTRLKGDAEALTSDLRLAQQRTIGEQVTYLVKLFDTTPPKYQLLKRQNGTDTLIKERALSTGIRWQSLGTFTNHEVVFTPTGAVSESSAIVLASSDNAQASVEVKPSGYVRTN